MPRMKKAATHEEKKAEAELPEEEALAKEAAALVKTETSEALQFFQGFDVLDQESLELAAEALVDLRKKLKESTARRRRFTDPLTAAITEAKSWFADGEALITECENILKAKIAEYHAAVAQLNMEAITSASAAHAEGDHRGVTEALAAVTTPEATSGVSVHERWDFKLANIELVFSAFLQLNEAEVRKYMNAEVAAGREPVIPGVTFFKRPVVAVRTA